MTVDQVAAIIGFNRMKAGKIAPSENSRIASHDSSATY
jgi:hypothetical protein